MRKPIDSASEGFQHKRLPEQINTGIPSSKECKGYVTCQLSGKALRGASISIDSGSICMGTSTAADGSFKMKLESVLLEGNHRAEINCLGYQKKSISLKELLAHNEFALVKSAKDLPPSIEWAED